MSYTNKSKPEYIGGFGNSRWEVVRKGGSVQKFVHMYVHGKMTPVETIARMGKGKIKESDGGSEFKYDIFDTL
jgi:hypothetical protein